MAESETELYSPLETAFKIIHMSSPKSFLLLWVLVSSSCLVFSDLISSATPFLLIYWCSLGLVQGILLGFYYSSGGYRWALTSAIFGLSLCFLLISVPWALSGSSSSRATLLSPSLALKGFVLIVPLSRLPYLYFTAYDVIPGALGLAIICGLFMFVGGSFLGDIQQRALGIGFSWWWLLASGLVWTVGTVLFFMGGFLFTISDFSKDYALILALLISGTKGSFIKGISLVFLFNRERSRDLDE